MASINNQTFYLAESGNGRSYFQTDLAATHCSLGSAPLDLPTFVAFTPTPGSFSGALRELSVSEHARSSAQDRAGDCWGFAVQHLQVQLSHMIRGCKLARAQGSVCGRQPVYGRKDFLLSGLMLHGPDLQTPGCRYMRIAAT